MAQLAAYTDKENEPSHMSVKNIGHRQLSGIVGKTFSSHLSKTPALSQRTENNAACCTFTMKGPDQVRKALGDVNRLPSAIKPKNTDRAQKVPAVSCLQPPEPAARSNRLMEHELESDSQKIQTEQVSKSQPEEDEYPEIEHMPEYEEPEDNFADVWDPCNRPDTYIPELLDLHPVHIFPYRDMDGDQDNSLLEDDLSTSLENFRIPDVTLEDADEQLETDDYYPDMSLPAPSDDVWRAMLDN